ncbi:uncharacterized protein LOC130827194 [Amaranthus tricolor]|uniref:uncharacterized protein LOC130827194 n=1 Tax=Amaranthus tricolor TaxID=29722 RepID=UPI00258AAA5E|nr:uncharacterized protein LOC130827194 [Amaranthus tricolor]
MMPFCTNLVAVFTFVQVNVAAVVEEIVYRGFLLTSLTKWVATPTALLLSSVAFGLLHVGAQRFDLSVFPPHFFFDITSFTKARLQCDLTIGILYLESSILSMRWWDLGLW